MGTPLGHFARLRGEKCFLPRACRGRKQILSLSPLRRRNSTNGPSIAQGQRTATVPPRGRSFPAPTAARDVTLSPETCHAPAPQGGRETCPRVPDGPLFGVEIGHVFHDGLLHVLRFRAPAPQVHPVGQSMTVRAQRYEVLHGIGTPFPARYHVVYLDVPGTVAEGTAPAVPPVYLFPGLFADVRVHVRHPFRPAAPAHHSRSRAGASPGIAFTLDAVIRWTSGRSLSPEAFSPPPVQG